MPSKKVSTYLRYSKGTKQWIGGKRIITLTGWTHLLHTNAKRKCVSILASIAEHRNKFEARWAWKENKRVGLEESA